MAIAKRDKEVKVIKDEVILTLTPDEAQAVLDVLEHVGGSKDNTRRGLTDAVLSALRSAGVLHQPRAGRDVDGSIYFLPEGAVKR